MTRTCLLMAVFCLSVGSCLEALTAQGEDSVTKSGYVTEVRGPHEFALNGLLVETDGATAYKPMDKKSEASAEQLQQAVQVGAYIRVRGCEDRVSHTMHASLVQVREDWNKELIGAGVIEKVLDAGAEPVFQADGYKVRITAATELSLSKKMKSISETGPGYLIRFKGIRDAKGVLVAEKAGIAPNVSWWQQASSSMSSAQGENAPRQLSVPKEGAFLDVNGNFAGLHANLDVKDAGGMCGWHRVSTDVALQNRVENVGVRVVPAYLMKLEDNDKAKIHFRFYVVEEEMVRSDLVCVPGLILIPRKVVGRLKNDDQLAALLADGVAWNLQRFASEAIEKHNKIDASFAVGLALASVPFGLVADGIVIEHEMNKLREEERGRIALELMADGGFDPWQAPEAWRLVAEKKPKPDSVSYPDRSGYQLGVLNLQYRDKGTVAGPAEF